MGPDGKPEMKEGAPQFHPATYPSVVPANDSAFPNAVGYRHPLSGQPHPQAGESVFGLKNVVGEMDVDIEVDTQPDTGTVAQEQFTDLVKLIGINPIYAQQMPLNELIRLSTIPHKRGVLDQIKQAAQEAQAGAAKQQELAMAAGAAKIAETQAKAGLHTASGQAKMIDAVAYTHASGSDHIVAGFQAGQDQAQHEQQLAHERALAQSSQTAQQQSQESDQAHQADMAARTDQSGSAGP